MAVTDRRESNVRSYSRTWPVEFDRAEGVWLEAVGGRRFLDFFAGAGSLNYGHNNSVLREALVRHLERGGTVQSLDMATTARRAFLESFTVRVLEPQRMEHLVQFPGPAGTNAVEAALRLARKVTKRSRVLYFEGSYHGMSLGASSVSSGSKAARDSLRFDTRAVPFATDPDSLAQLRRALEEDSPAAVILETVQGEGGIRLAESSWLRAVSALCAEAGALLVVDDIQMGAGRTGPYLSFEDTAITPDIVCLSKSLSGYGMPLSLLLIRPEHDVWLPGEFSGTFRGFDLAMVTARAALEHFWLDNALRESTLALGARAIKRLRTGLEGTPATVRGRGLAIGIELPDETWARAVSRVAFAAGVLVETCGSHGQVVKLIPPLTITPEELVMGIDLVLDAVVQVSAREPS
ncbi:diaminobutyrate-2-oxoglutarate transaminase [Tessaracoccus bendigoensis DSM 12906]|uniref:Diaminobutyrate--2-oxoglutarate transaminase n=1 Tax=Tessaracoccus bendigoensis DSM 12906 TaxID=1123357 RepID=A0A1M6LMD4_9ACTN|nr:diaminobutyrate--2-oxoglutarate transaminase [Tessaracoccus bendigoensis]SHJ72330.1 diaminobutyrate-2-oxoglutarate transaminase [Tessaracoccus bendigoensis DSM 12906]